VRRGPKNITQKFPKNTKKDQRDKSQKQKTYRPENQLKTTGQIQPNPSGRRKTLVFRGVWKEKKRQRFGPARVPRRKKGEAGKGFLTSKKKKRPGTISVWEKEEKGPEKKKKTYMRGMGSGIKNGHSRKRGKKLRLGGSEKKERRVRVLDESHLGGRKKIGGVPRP